MVSKNRKTLVSRKDIPVLDKIIERELILKLFSKSEIEEKFNEYFVLSKKYNKGKLRDFNINEYKIPIKLLIIEFLVKESLNSIPSQSLKDLKLKGLNQLSPNPTALLRYYDFEIQHNKSQYIKSQLSSSK